MIRPAILVLFVSAIAGSTVWAQDIPTDPEQLGKRAVQVMKTHCYRCHGVEQKVPDLNVLSAESLLKVRGDETSKYAYIVAGKIDDSRLWERAGGDNPDMPPGQPKTTPADRAILKAWIEAGAPMPKGREIKFRSDLDTLNSIGQFLFTVDESDRPFMKFFSLTHLHNNERVSEDDLRLYRAALSKALNSLTWERGLTVPRVVEGSQDTLYAVDIRKLGWDKKNMWLEILKAYPYGLKFSDSRDAALKARAKDIERFSGDDLPYIRADWFVVNATQPPLYHTLLELPTKIKELEKKVGVDFEENFKSTTAGNQRLARAGFVASGVSKQNRLVERHDALFGYWWISYDFKPRRAKADLMRFPLGPKFEANKFPKFVFEHDGGEAIWSLPNGMQAYILIDGKGDRIDSGPIDVVNDPRAVSGTPAIVNGMSCMHCHRRGMISNFRDQVRDSQSVSGEVLRKVEDLYPKFEVMAELTARDEQQFMTSLLKVVGPFLKVGDDKNRDIDEFPEPVGRVAELYLGDLTLTEVALELGLPNGQEVKSRITGNRELLKLGIGSLAQDPPGTLKREKWEARDGTSLMQDFAVELRTGLIPWVPSGK